MLEMSFEKIDLQTKVEMIKGLKTLRKRYVLISSDAQLATFSDVFLGVRVRKLPTIKQMESFIGGFYTM